MTTPSPTSSEEQEIDKILSDLVDGQAAEEAWIDAESAILQLLNKARRDEWSYVDDECADEETLKTKYIRIYMALKQTNKEEV